MDKDQKQNTDTRRQNQSQESTQPEKVSQDRALRSEDLPESTNESQGNMGSGQRQDSN